MSIQIEVPFDALQKPGVAKALADLMVSLGGHRSAAAIAAPAPAPAAPRAARAAAPRKKAAAPARPVPAGTDDERWSAYFNALPEPSRRFLTLLKERGTLGVDDAVSELGLKSSKAMGGLTGAMARWAPKHEIALPFEKTKDENGKRCWVWTRD